jgi:hypothetical protein
MVGRVDGDAVGELLAVATGPSVECADGDGDGAVVVGERWITGDLVVDADGDFPILDALSI